MVINNHEIIITPPWSLITFLQGKRLFHCVNCFQETRKYGENIRSLEKERLELQTKYLHQSLDFGYKKNK